MLLIILVSVAAGITNVMGRNLNLILANEIGLFQGTFFNYITGLLFSTAFLVLSGEFFKLSSVCSESLPFYAYLGGLIGVIIVALSSFAAAKLSSFYLTLMMFIGQLFAGILIDYFTVGIISKGKIIGGLLVVLGLAYNLFVDRKTVQ